jgi:hypothetical protein
MMKILKARSVMSTSAPMPCLRKCCAKFLRLKLPVYNSQAPRRPKLLLEKAPDGYTQPISFAWIICNGCCIKSQIRNFRIKSRFFPDVRTRLGEVKCRAMVPVSEHGSEIPYKMVVAYQKSVRRYISGREKS